MLFDVSRMREARERFAHTYPADAFTDIGGDDYRIVAPVELKLDIQKDRQAFRVAGTVRTVLEIACSRCLEGFRVPIDRTFDLRYIPQTENVGEGELEVQEDDLSTAYYREGAIDLTEMLREQFYLALPMKPLCDEACTGLCPDCGTNLNQATCDCKPKWEDPRLAGLKKLIKED